MKMLLLTLFINFLFNLFVNEVNLRLITLLTGRRRLNESATDCEKAD